MRRPTSRQRATVRGQKYVESGFWMRISEFDFSGARSAEAERWCFVQGSSHLLDQTFAMAGSSGRPIRAVSSGRPIRAVRYCRYMVLFDGSRSSAGVDSSERAMAIQK